MTIEETFRDASFQVVSIMTTTGFVTANYQLWLPVTHVLLVILMVIGGSAGATSGGIKVIRVIVAVKGVLRQTERNFRSRVVRPLMVNGKMLDDTALIQVVTYLVMVFIIGAISLFIVAWFERTMSFQGSFSAVISSLSISSFTLSTVPENSLPEY